MMEERFLWRFQMAINEDEFSMDFLLGRHAPFIVL